MILWVFLALIVLFVVLPLTLHIVGMVIWAAFIGIIFGGLGRLIVPGHNPIGVLATIACGLAGSLLGAVLGHALSRGHFVTILIEIGLAAAAVAIWSASQRRTVSR